MTRATGIEGLLGVACDVAVQVASEDMLGGDGGASRDGHLSSGLRRMVAYYDGELAAGKYEEQEEAAVVVRGWHGTNGQDGEAAGVSA